MKPRIILLTNLSNGAYSEDLRLYEALHKKFSVVVAHPGDVVQDLPRADLALIRNIWPTGDYKATFRRFRRTLVGAGQLTYNPLVGKGDAAGKTYLSRLGEEGEAVIPTGHGAISPPPAVGSTLNVWKPIDEGGGRGLRILVAGRDSEDFSGLGLLQPFINIAYEFGAVFVDDQFCYAIRFDNKLMNDEHGVLYSPSSDELALAKRFVRWNGLPFGIQRVDLCVTIAGECLLVEIEDLCPYLYLQDIHESLRQEAMEMILRSIERSLGHVS